MWDVNDIAVRIITNAIPILIFGMGKSVQNIDYYNRIKKKKTSLCIAFTDCRKPPIR